MKDILDVHHLIGAIVYSGLGMLVFSAWFVLFDKLTPYDLWQEITVKQNRALATVVAGCAVAVGLIISASMIG
jgi:hypothetical protein